MPGGEIVGFRIEEDDSRWEKLRPLLMRQMLAHASEVEMNEGSSAQGPSIAFDSNVAKLQWLEGYSGQTTEELLALEGNYRIDSLILAFEQAIGQKAARQDGQGLTDEERVVLALEALEREVNNGGYDQFFTNSSRVFAASAVESLRRVGCTKTADITRRAIEALGASDLNSKTIEMVMSANDQQRQETLSLCDGAYYKAAEPTADLLFAFIKANKTRIRI
jgi:hypothetical protein